MADDDTVIVPVAVAEPEPEKEKEFKHRVDTSFTPLPKQSAYTEWVSRYFGVGRQQAI